MVSRRLHSACSLVATGQERRVKSLWYWFRFAWSTKLWEPQGRRGGLKVYGIGFASLGPRNYESNLSSFVAVQLLDFWGFFCCLYWFLRQIYVSVWFGSWKAWRPSGLSYVLGSGVLKIFVWMVCRVFCGCFEVLLRRERLPFASQSVRLELVRHNADMMWRPNGGHVPSSTDNGRTSQS